ncbi:hypothetical protein [Streptomyces halobius]|uniref:Transmembrane protein n=1 Tax=Streptomyces halobius TaxID=2879846 RepID=A0ABY4M8Y3_9ACTN|nr:hypothetical protein [Streptomyces halobius]UQA92836.1 hypothetical protein K9S39_14235 [Streptomyces halobius]
MAEHEITGCPKCDADAHRKAGEEREKQQREANVRPINLVVAATAAGLVLFVLWAGLMAVLSRIG